MGIWHWPFLPSGTFALTLDGAGPGPLAHYTVGPQTALPEPSAQRQRRERLPTHVLLA